MSLVAACGGHLTPTYFQLLETEISEVLYHLEIFRATQERINPQATPKGKLEGWGMGDIEFE